MTTRTVLLALLDRDGYALQRAIFDQETLATLREASPTVVRGGVRNLLGVDAAFGRLLTHAPLRGIVEEVLDGSCILTRAILFDKSPDANWAVGFHRDTVVAVTSRSEAPGFGPWSTKDGLPHVRPPAEVLEQMLTVRVHLDDCPSTNAPLRVIPGSHLRGFLSEEEIAREVERGSAVACTAAAGDVLLMRPLLLHASSKQEVPGRRRIVHLEFASRELPCGLSWARA